MLYLLTLNDLSDFILIVFLNFFHFFFLQRSDSLLFKKLILGKSCCSLSVKFRFTLLIWLCFFRCLFCCLSKLLLTQLFWNNFFCNPFLFSELSQKFIINFSNQVQTARFSILFKQFLHLLQCLRLILDCRAGTAMQLSAPICSVKNLETCLSDCNDGFYSLYTLSLLSIPGSLKYLPSVSSFGNL